MPYHSISSTQPSQAGIVSAGLDPLEPQQSRRLRRSRFLRQPPSQQGPQVGCPANYVQQRTPVCMPGLRTPEPTFLIRSLFTAAQASRTIAHELRSRQVAGRGRGGHRTR